jgi:hypothetical protein
MSSAIRLHDRQLRTLTTDARIVAIRWDLVEWGVVLDLDVAVSEAKNAAMRRAWLVFPGVSEMTIAIQEARLPTGIWLTSSLEELPDDDGFRIFSCQALLPVFYGNTVRPTGTSSTLSIRAQNLLGVVSQGSDIPGEHGLGFESRQRLCDDQEMLSSVVGR